MLNFFLEEKVIREILKIRKFKSQNIEIHCYD